MIRMTLIIAALFLSACVTSYKEQQANELTKKSRFIYKKPQIERAQRTGIPYGAQQDYHALVEGALRIWIEKNKGHVICIGEREARIGVLTLGLESCGDIREEYWQNGDLNPPGLEIGPIDVGTDYGDRPFVSLTAFEFGYAGNAGSRTGQVYACVRRGNSMQSDDGKTWTIQYPDRRLPYYSCAGAEFIYVT